VGGIVRSFLRPLVMEGGRRDGVRLRWGQSSGRIWRKIWPCRLTSHKVVSIQVKITTKSIRGAAGDKLRYFPRQRSHHHGLKLMQNTACGDAHIIDALNGEIVATIHQHIL